jgi:general secretion pathway protein G
MTATSIKISFRPRSNRSPRLSRGFTLIELTIALGIIGLLSSIAGSRYLAYIEKVRVASAVASIRAMSVQLDDFVRSDESLPATLSEVGMGDMVDPWGHPFQYLPFTTTSSGSGASGGSAGDSSGSGDSGGSAGSSSGSGDSGDSAGSSSGSGDSGTTPDDGSYLGEARKDYFLVPLNSEYDLYSVGKDGESRPPLSVPVSADDVIRANDGAYVGLAANY